MAVKRRVSWLSQQRVDTPDMRSLESAASNDFDELIKSFVTGNSQGYILRGFEMSMSGAIGGAASALQLVVDPGSVFHIASSQSGTFLLVPSGTPAQQLNSATNTIVDGAFAPSAINYVGLEYERFIDDTTSSQVYVWDPTTNSETVKNAPRAQILRYRIKITTSIFASNVLPIATVTTDAGNNVVSITDARWMLFRLATGGASPNPFFVYPWNAQSEGRVENPSTSSSNSINPFHGGDKMIMSLKDWMNAIMTSIQEIKGTIYWYSPGAAGSIDSLRTDLGNTVTTGSGTISHGVLPNTSAALTTTGNITINSNQLTNLASTAGIVVGQIIMGPNIPSQTTVASILGSTVTMSSNATATTVGITVSFFAASFVTAPGQVNWDQDIFLDVIGSRLAYKFAANPSSSDITLADNEAAYVTLVRDVQVSPNLVFTNGSAVIQSVGLISWTSLLQPGDFVKLGADTVSGYYKILTVDSLSQVTLTIPYAGSSTGAGGAKGKYSFGTYSVSASPSTGRDIFIVDRSLVPQNQDVWWFLLREDNGGITPRVYVRFIGQELEQGDSNAIDDGIPKQLLAYIGSPLESARFPQYVSALNPGSIPEATYLTFGAASSIASNQYFFINSAGDSRKYYVWFNKNGTGVDPAPAADRIGVEVDISTGQTNVQVAALVATALANTFSPDFLTASLASPNNMVVRVTNSSAGTTTHAVNFNVGAPFSAQLQYTFSVTSANATVGATYTNNGQTFTVLNTIAPGTTLVTFGSGAPTSSGTLTKSSGTGDATITFSSFANSAGTGVGNLVISDGDSLTLAIKKLDEAYGLIVSTLDSPSYDEPVDIVASGATPPTSLNSPVVSGTNVSLPNNTRVGNAVQHYTVGKGSLEVFLNGQYLRLGIDWTEVGAAGTASNAIQIQQSLLTGDSLEFRISSGGGGGAGGGGGVGPQGPAGPTGPAGADAIGGPIAISTKTSNYTVLNSDNVLLGDATGGNIQFSLPSAASAISQVFFFKKIDASANTITVKANGAELIDGSNTFLINTQYAAVTLVSDGTQFWIL